MHGFFVKSSLGAFSGFFQNFEEYRFLLQDIPWMRIIFIVLMASMGMLAVSMLLQQAPLWTLTAISAFERAWDSFDRDLVQMAFKDLIFALGINALLKNLGAYFDAIFSDYLFYEFELYFGKLLFEHYHALDSKDFQILQSIMPYLLWTLLSMIHILIDGVQLMFLDYGLIWTIFSNPLLLAFFVIYAVLEWAFSSFKQAVPPVRAFDELGGHVSENIDLYQSTEAASELVAQYQKAQSRQFWQDWIFQSYVSFRYIVIACMHTFGPYFIYFAKYHHYFALAIPYAVAQVEVFGLFAVVSTMVRLSYRAFNVLMFSDYFKALSALIDKVRFSHQQKPLWAQSLQESNEFRIKGDVFMPFKEFPLEKYQVDYTFSKAHIFLKGGNGQGKSTLSRLIFGLLPLNFKHARYAQDVTRFFPKDAWMRYVTVKGDGFFGSRGVEQALPFPYTRALSDQERESAHHFFTQVFEVSKQNALDDYFGGSHKKSSGQAQIIQLAAVYCELCCLKPDVPKFLILDESLNAIEASKKKRITQLFLEKFPENGKSVLILVEHGEEAHRPYQAQGFEVVEVQDILRYQDSGFSTTISLDQ